MPDGAVKMVSAACPRVLHESSPKHLEMRSFWQVVTLGWAQVCYGGTVWLAIRDCGASSCCLYRGDFRTATIYRQAICVMSVFFLLPRAKPPSKTTSLHSILDWNVRNRTVALPKRHPRPAIQWRKKRSAAAYKCSPITLQPRDVGKSKST